MESGVVDVVGQGCVLQRWVQNMSWKRQSALMASFRGPDTRGLAKVKIVTKWIRASCQENADPSTTFMKVTVDELPSPVEFCEELQYASVHFMDHIITGLALMAEYHADGVLRAYAADFVGEMYGKHLHAPNRLAMAGR